MVYFGSVEDDTLKAFTSIVKVNKSYTIADILSSEYWFVEDLNGVLKCIPLFNTDEISSDNPNDVIIDKNKCIICENKDTTLISCKGDYNPVIGNSGYNLYAYTIDYDNIYCIVTDKYNTLIKNGIITVYKDNISQGTVKTDKNGICKYKKTENGSYYFELNTYQSNSVVIS